MLSALRDFLTLLIERFVATRCPHVAGSLTYTSLLALVPLVTVSIALFSNFPAFADLGEALSGFIQANVLPERAGEIVTTYALQFSEKAAQLTLIGTVMLVVTVLLLLNTIEAVFNDIWGVRKPRPMLARFTVYWVALTLGPVALAGSVFATGRLVAASIAYIGDGAHIGAFTTTLVPLVLLGSLFSFLYFATPNHSVRIVHAIIGGFAAAFAFLLMQRLFGQFIARFPTYTLIYGTFAALPIFLAWLYMSWVVVLLGAILAATLPDFAERKRCVERFPGDRAWAALNMLVALARAQRSGRTGPFDMLKDCSGVASDEAERVLGEMRDVGWIARTEDETWVLSRRAESISLTQIIDHFALSTGSWLAASGGHAESVAYRLREGLDVADLTLDELAAEPLTGDDQIG